MAGRFAGARMGMSAQKKNETAMNKRNRSKVRRPSRVVAGGMFIPPTGFVDPEEEATAEPNTRPSAGSMGLVSVFCVWCCGVRVKCPPPQVRSGQGDAPLSVQVRGRLESYFLWL
ncbi:hypothetical protein E2C01_036248 [Portunus trituberculatus]|uniref:Uncharacterized protein n=1 Tax=Portunus trituberculatus TaxID=210409 RepID=A0A5B7FDQ8_PORTR|nr:hypothetical protein [Portunus trituberculatus]